MNDIQRSELVKVMLENGFSYIICEVADEDRIFDKFEGNIVVINGYENGYFTDVEGDDWKAAQPIKPNGHVMSYNDFISLQLLYNIK